MSKRPFVIFGTFAAFCAVIAFLAIASEGAEDAAPIEVAAQDEDAKELFAVNCGTCHRLAAAGTDGVVGPDLDEVIGVTTQIGGEEAFLGGYTQTLNAVSCGIGGRMPAGIVESDNAREVSAFVAAYAGRLSPGQGPGVDTSEVEKPEPAPCSAGDAP